MKDEGNHQQSGGSRELLVLRAGGRAFAVYAEEAEGVAAWETPAPLPHAPAAVLGVVCVRGRMRTVLDPSALFGRRPEGIETAPRLLVTLRGDEQLALAAEETERLTRPPEGLPETIQLLDTSRLFEAAMRGAERRRPRLK